VHAQVDSSIENIDKACQKGCSACCHQIVDVFTWEEPRIFEYIHKTLNRAIKRKIGRNIEKWFNKFNSYTRDANRQSPLNFQDILKVQHIFREQRIPCPFLIDSKCSIYEVRPMVCRVHYEKESANRCEIDPHKNTPQDAQDICRRQSEKFNPEIFPVAMKPLPYLVATEFNIEIQSKPMMGVVYDPNKIFNRI